MPKGNSKWYTTTFVREMPNRTANTIQNPALKQSWPEESAPASIKLAQTWKKRKGTATRGSRKENVVYLT